MRRLSRSVQAIALLFAFTACAGATQQTKATQPAVNPDAAALADFQQRIDAYMKLHKDAASKTTQPKPTHDTAKIQAARETLAATIQSMRKDAKPGDIFTPAVQAKFRKFMSPQFKGKTGTETKQEMTEDAAEGVPLKVNAKYPEKSPVTTMTPNVLSQLPTLPKDLEYRIVGRTLILRDVAANLVVDFIPKAIPVTIHESDER